jgi:hypothetical protein
MKIIAGLSPEDVLLRNFRKQHHELVVRLSGSDFTITVVEGDEVVAWSPITKEAVAKLAKDVATKFWYKNDNRSHFHNRKKTFQYIVSEWVNEGCRGAFV